MRVVMPVVEYPLARPVEGAEVVVVEGDYGYGNLLADLWESGEDFCIVEQDILLTEEVRDELSSCHSVYCAAPYNLGDGRGLGTSLGCVRWRGQLTRKVPLAGTPWRELRWDVLDGGVDHLMREILHIDVHVHDDALLHLHTREGDRPTDDPYVIVVAESDEWIRYRDLRDGRDWKEDR